MNEIREIPNPITLSVVKKTIELNAEKKLQKCIQSNTENVNKSLLQIMEEGASEFHKSTGRNMTYSEMREMFG